MFSTDKAIEHCIQSRGTNSRKSKSKLILLGESGGETNARQNADSGRQSEHETDHYSGEVDCRHRVEDDCKLKH